MRKTFAILALLWTFAIIVFCLIDLSVIANRTPKVSIPYIDKWMHFTIYVIFAFLWRMAIDTGKTKNWAFIFFAIAFGVIIEIAQQYTGYRSFEWHDIIANSLGVISGFVLVQIIKKSSRY